MPSACYHLRKVPQKQAPPLLNANATGSLSLLTEHVLTPTEWMFGEIHLGKCFLVILSPQRQGYRNCCDIRPDKHSRPLSVHCVPSAVPKSELI